MYGTIITIEEEVMNAKRCDFRRDELEEEEKYKWGKCNEVIYEIQKNILKIILILSILIIFFIALFSIEFSYFGWFF